MSAPACCTILARNYLPGALALAASLRANGARHPLTVLLTDARPDQLPPEQDGVRWLTPFQLGLDERTVLELAMAYDLVELATAVKPLLLSRLLGEHEQVVYLDPDTYVVSEMDELEGELRGSAGILLTPHFLRAVPPGSSFSEGHLLVVGVFNLGFCAVDRRALEMLAWWWSHLREECLHDPLSGLFVDQKWMDLAGVLFDARPLKHLGYNVGAANLHERPIARDDCGYLIAGTGDRLRLFHFHAFDPHRPDLLYARASTGKRAPAAGAGALRSLCRDYAALVLEQRGLLGPPPPYGWARDCGGRAISRHMRRAHRAAVATASAAGEIPSPFVAEEKAAYERWRRRALGPAARLTMSDLAKALRLALPDEYDALKRRFPGLTRTLRARYLEGGGWWA